ncbi:glycosyltransferase family 32 protein [Rhizobium helianthi]|uniref:Glycosyltransferase family 32 protein n=1 Tax=Rhizobium helianthi TaxID=1132695 RepID=A0ABW4M1J2_9HYPH
MTHNELPTEDARKALERAREWIEAGKLDDAERLLNEIAAMHPDPVATRLGSPTTLGLPRKVQSALLKIAKKRGDTVRKAGLQYSLVPPPELLLPLCTVLPVERKEMNALNRQPVPRVLHQIWLGNLDVPPAAARWRDHAAKNGFHYKLWRENDLEALGVQRHPAFMDMMEAGDFPGAVDVARYFILYEQGGIYLDCDWYPARDDESFADLLPLLGLSALAEETPRDTGAGGLLLTNSFIAAPPHHPVFARLLDILPEATRLLPDGPAWWSTGPLIMTLLFRQTVFSVPDAAFVADTLPRRAPIEAVERARQKSADQGKGLLIGWKSW